MRPARVISILSMLGLSVCGPGRVGSSGETRDGDTESLGDSTEASSAELDSSESETDDPDPTGLGFVTDDVCGFGFRCSPINCNVFEQDCPSGEKCTVWTTNGLSWDASKCVPVLGDLEPGEPCIHDGNVEATDNCGPSSMCYGGICQSFCAGSPDAPSCPVGLGCGAGPDYDPIPLCLAICDPLARDCANGSCYWANQQFLCNPAGEIAIGEPCGFVDDCIGGSACIDGELLPTCLGSGCCSPFCNLDQPDCASLPGTECVAWFEPGQAPAGLELVGVCLSP